MYSCIVIKNFIMLISYSIIYKDNNYTTLALLAL